MLADTSAPAEPIPPPAPGAVQAPSVSFKTAEVDRDGFYATGSATPPGERLRIYLNGAHIADVAAAADDHWSLTVKGGLSPGHYTLRADAIDAAQKVSARAEVGFDVPVLTASAAPNPSPHGAAPAIRCRDGARMRQMQQRAEVPPALPRRATMPSCRALGTATVIHGDSLWRISRKILGHGMRYTLDLRGQCVANPRPGSDLSRSGFRRAASIPESGPSAGGIGRARLARPPGDLRGCCLYES